MGCFFCTSIAAATATTTTTNIPTTTTTTSTTTTTTKLAKYISDRVAPVQCNNRYLFL